MNEQIEGLAEQAGLKQRIWNSLGKELPMWQEDPDNPGLAKFAELIVEEMYDFIMEESAKDNGIPDLGKVKEHFGVEEK